MHSVQLTVYNAALTTQLLPLWPAHLMARACHLRLLNPVPDCTTFPAAPSSQRCPTVSQRCRTLHWCCTMQPPSPAVLTPETVQQIQQIFHAGLAALSSNSAMGAPRPVLPHRRRRTHHRHSTQAPHSTSYHSPATMYHTPPTLYPATALPASPMSSSSESSYTSTSSGIMAGQLNDMRVSSGDEQAEQLLQQHQPSPIKRRNRKAEQQVEGERTQPRAKQRLTSKTSSARSMARSGHQRESRKHWVTRQSLPADVLLEVPPLPVGDLNTTDDTEMPQDGSSLDEKLPQFTRD